MYFTPIFEARLKELYVQIESSDSRKAGRFLEAVQDLREALETDLEKGEFFTITSDGTVLHSHPVFFSYRVIYTVVDTPTLVWIEAIE